MTEIKEKTVAPKAESFKIVPLIAEMFGTFILAALVIKFATGGITGAIAIAFGLTLLIMAFGAMSGAHLNPAVTIAMVINRKMPVVKGLFYIIAQVIGALLALIVMKAIYTATQDQTLTQALIAKAGVTQDVITKAGGVDKYLDTIIQNYASQGQAMTKSQLLTNLGVTEFINVSVAKGTEMITFFQEVLGSIIFGVGLGHALFAEKKSMLETGFAVGFGLLGGLMVGGATVILNPAMGVAVGAFTHMSNLPVALLIYVLGTVIGITIGMTAYRFLRQAALKD